MSLPLETARLLTEARDHHRGGRLARAEQLYRAVLERQPDQPDALNLLGVLASQIGRFKDAVRLIDRAVDIDAGNAGYWANLGGVYQRWGRHKEAVVAFEQGLAVSPGDFSLQMRLAGSLRESGELRSSAAAYERAIALDPGSAVAYFGHGGALKALGRLDDAIESLRRARSLNPNADKIAASLGAYLLERGNTQAALGALDECLAIEPRSTVALAYKAVALGALERRDEQAALLDFDRLVRRERFAAAGTDAELHEFNAALVDQIKRQCAWLPDTANLATRHGRQSEELPGDAGGALKTLREFIDRSVRAYLADLPRDPGHAFLRDRPGAWQLSVWSVMLESQGHQLPHMHGDGWVSGVYYAALPDAVKQGTVEHAGWIEFGRPPDELASGETHALRLVAPEEGVLVLFPSYFYHRTVPYTSREQRVSVAFDAIPIWE